MGTASCNTAEWVSRLGRQAPPLLEPYMLAGMLFSISIQGKALPREGVKAFFYKPKYNVTGGKRCMASSFYRTGLFIL